VSRRVISDAVAGKNHYKCDTAPVVTNAAFTKGAKALVEITGCLLIGSNSLAEWMHEMENFIKGRTIRKERT